MFKVGDKVRLNEDDSNVAPYLVKTDYLKYGEEYNVDDVYIGLITYETNIEIKGFWRSSRLFELVKD